MLSDAFRRQIERKIAEGIRLSRDEGLALLHSHDLAWLGYLANKVRQRVSGDYVYFNVNRHVNLTNVCTARCKFCAFGCDASSPQAYSMTKEHVLRIARQAAEDPDLRELHIVSGLHPEWPFEYYVDIIATVKEAVPRLHLKAFTAVEIHHFAKISGKSVEEVLKTLKAAGLGSMPGGGAEIFSPRVRNLLCPNKASGEDWLAIIRTAHRLGIRTNASMLYGHIETPEERIDHLLALRDLQDETGGFQTFIGLAFHPKNTELENQVVRVPAWEDLKMVALARLMLDNFKHIKAYWVMLTLPVAQLALAFGANDLDGTVSEEKITHAAGGKSERSLSIEQLVNVIRQAGRIPVERDSLYNIVKIYRQ
ncbi:aminofutalosine synthase MqnE [Sporolituus thermophilus]|uniref:Aminodeoxyfutalosine synthase n=1 Tax=Sporolituus thermophilus DSM 23256 TaxID=1123285 RepID=A0A1G7IAH3_9FIRM|nr:aminofutalosine synthase MqnE [Sporolituus thermophilus]SDF09578.1 aminodeoxyfutalosine synthase [Sporolituus thermophilus DSM 23256]